jgi:hypothetical protein
MGDKYNPSKQDVVSPEATAAAFAIISRRTTFHIQEDGYET